MIIDFNQTRASFGLKYQAIDSSGQVIKDVEMPIHLRTADTYINCATEVRQYTMHHDALQSFKDVGVKQTEHRWNLFTICGSQNNIIGEIFGRTPKRFSGFRYTELEMNGRTFRMYPIGLGKQGLKLPIYCGDEQIALIEKDIVTYDNKDTYHIYVKDESFLDIAIIFNIHYDYVAFSHYDEIAIKKKEVNYIYTFNKELKTKWDPAFKDACL